MAFTAPVEPGKGVFVGRSRRVSATACQHLTSAPRLTPICRVVQGMQGIPVIPSREITPASSKETLHTLHTEHANPAQLDDLESWQSPEWVPRSAIWHHPWPATLEDQSEGVPACPPPAADARNLPGTGVGPRLSARARGWHTTSHLWL